MRIDVERRLTELEKANGVDDEELIIIHAVIVHAHYPPPNPNEFPPVEQQVAEARARGEKRFWVYSNEQHMGRTV